MSSTFSPPEDTLLRPLLLSVAQPSEDGNITAFCNYVNNNRREWNQHYHMANFALNVFSIMIVTTILRMVYTDPKVQVHPWKLYVFDFLLALSLQQTNYLTSPFDQCNNDLSKMLYNSLFKFYFGTLPSEVEQFRLIRIQDAFYYQLKNINAFLFQNLNLFIVKDMLDEMQNPFEIIKFRYTKIMAKVFLLTLFQNMIIYFGASQSLQTNNFNQMITCYDGTDDYIDCRKNLDRQLAMEQDRVIHFSRSFFIIINQFVTWFVILYMSRRLLRPGINQVNLKNFFESAASFIIVLNSLWIVFLLHDM